MKREKKMVLVVRKEQAENILRWQLPYLDFARVVPKFSRLIEVVP